MYKITPQERKFDPEVSIEQDDLYASASEYDYGRPVFDTEYNNAAAPISHELAVRSDWWTEKVWNTPGNPRERSPEYFSPNRRTMWRNTNMFPQRT